MFLLLDIRIKNTGDSEQEVRGYNSPALLHGEDAIEGVDNLKADVGTSATMDLPQDEFVDKLTEDLKPGEEIEGKMLYEVIPSDKYELVYGWGLDTVSDEVTWVINGDENK